MATKKKPPNFFPLQLIFKFLHNHSRNFGLIPGKYNCCPLVLLPAKYKEKNVTIIIILLL